MKTGELLTRVRVLLTGKSMPKIVQPRKAEPSTINARTVADFSRVVEQTGILKPTAAGDD